SLPPALRRPAARRRGGPRRTPPAPATRPTPGRPRAPSPTADPRPTAPRRRFAASACSTPPLHVRDVLLRRRTRIVHGAGRAAKRPFRGISRRTARPDILRLPEPGRQRHGRGRWRGPDRGG